MNSMLNTLRAVLVVVISASFFSAIAQNLTQTDKVKSNQASTMDEVVDDKIADRLGRADALVEARRYEEAIAEYKTAIGVSDKPVFTAHLNLGYAYFRKEDYRAAISAFKQAIAIRPDDWRGHSNLAEALYKVEDYREAEVEYRKVLALEVDRLKRPQIYHSLGSMLYQQKRIDEAIAEYRNAIEQMDNIYPEAHYNLGIALMERKEYQAAEREFRVALEQEKTLSDAHFNLAVSLEHQGRLREAIQEYEAYLKTEPEASDTDRLRSHIEQLKLRSK